MASGNGGSSSDAHNTQFNADDVKVIADLFASFTEGDCEQLLTRVLFDEFGKLLEQKFSDFQSDKAALKESIRKNIGESMVPKTPKRQKPTLVLLERIQRFKMISFMSDVSMSSTVAEPVSTKSRENTSKRRPAATTRAATRKGAKASASVMNVKKVWAVSKPTQASHSTPTSTLTTTKSNSVTQQRSAKADTGDTADKPSSSIKDPYAIETTSETDDAIKEERGATLQQKGRKKKTPFTPSQKAQSVFSVNKGIHSTARPFVAQSASKRVRNSSMNRKRSQQLKKFEEKAQSALKQKEDLLKDKAERAKRDREERRLRVEQNNRIKEAEQREREQQARAHEERVREFRLQQERQQQQQLQSARSPGPSGLAHANHPPLQRIPSNLSSTSSTAKSQSTTSRTPTLKQQQASQAKAQIFRPVFHSGLKSAKKLEIKPVAETIGRNHTPPLSFTPPVSSAAAQGEDLIVSAGGSTTPYPHQRADERDPHRDEALMDSLETKTTPKVITPRQVAIPTKKAINASNATTLATANGVKVVDQPKRKPALTAVERARQRDAERIEREMKAEKEREEALRQFRLLEEDEERKKKEAEEEEKRRQIQIHAEEQARLAKKRCEEEEARDREERRVKEEAERMKIQEAVEQAEKEMARKREAMLQSEKVDQKKLGSPFLPPGLPRSIAHISVVESVDGDSIENESFEAVTQVVREEKILAIGKAFEKELSYDGSISDDLTSSLAEIAPPVGENAHHKHNESTTEMNESTTFPDIANKGEKENEKAGPSKHLTFAQPKQPLLKPFAASKLNNKSNYDMTPDKVFMPATKDNYNVDDLSSNDETDNEDNPRKEVPKWASRTGLIREQAILRRHLTTQQIAHHFGKIQPPTSMKIFPSAKRDYDRSASAIWSSPLSDPTPGEAKFLLFQGVPNQ